MFFAEVVELAIPTWVYCVVAAVLYIGIGVVAARITYVRHRPGYRSRDALLGDIGAGLFGVVIVWPLALVVFVLFAAVIEPLYRFITREKSGGTDT